MQRGSDRLSPNVNDNYDMITTLRKYVNLFSMIGFAKTMTNVAVKCE
jgi:hypothetical protein